MAKQDEFSYFISYVIGPDGPNPKFRRGKVNLSKPITCDTAERRLAQIEASVSEKHGGAKVMVTGFAGPLPVDGPVKQVISGSVELQTSIELAPAPPSAKEPSGKLPPLSPVSMPAKGSGVGAVTK